MSSPILKLRNLRLPPVDNIIQKNKKNNCYTCVHITIIQLGRQGRVMLINLLNSTQQFILLFKMWICI